MQRETGRIKPDDGEVRNKQSLCLLFKILWKKNTTRKQAQNTQTKTMQLEWTKVCFLFYSQKKGNSNPNINNSQNSTARGTETTTKNYCGKL